VKVFVDVPNYFWKSDDPDRADVRTTYVSLFAALSRLGCEIVARPFRPYSDTLNRPDPAEGLHYAYHARDPGPGAYCIKGAALPDLWFLDPQGYSGWCALARDPALQARSAQYDLAAADAVIARYQHRFQTENLSRYAQPGRRTAASGERFAVFYPLQVNNDEVLKLSRFAQFEVLEALIQTAERLRRPVVVKRHPLCGSDHICQALEAAARSEFVTVSEDSIHDLIASSGAVLTANSGVGLQALVHGAPVFSLAASEYAHMTTPLVTLDALEAAFDAPDGPQPERIRRQLGFLLNEYWVNTRDEEAVFQRVRSQVEAWRTDQGLETGERHDEDRKRSGLLAMERRANDMVDHMLRLHEMASEADRGEIETLLLRSYRLDVRPELIVRRMSDRTFLTRCLAYRTKIGDEAGAAVVTGRLADLPDAGAEDLFAHARQLYRSGRDQEGMAVLRRMSRMAGVPAFALVFMGRKLLNHERAAGAEAALALADRAIDARPDQGQAHWLRARALYLLGRLDQAHEAAVAAVALNPEDKTFTQLLQRIVAASPAAGAAEDPS
jgi:tetratricopeptide (TPR) repeat protein